MENLIGMPINALMAQLTVGLVNGSFYALLSLGLAIIFGLLRVINFAHGALYMVGAFAGWLMVTQWGMSFWLALIVVPVVVAILGCIIEVIFLRRLTAVDPVYSLLLTFGIALVLEAVFRYYYGASGKPFTPPEELRGGMNLGFMFLPIYRGFIIAASALICLVVWLFFEKTMIGAYLRAATENPTLVRVFGINVPVLLTATFAMGCGLAGLAGLIAGPALQVNPLMGSHIIIVVFAVVVIGGMGSIGGSIIIGYGLGVIEALTKIIYPEASNLIVFILMAIVLCLRPSGLFGKGAHA